MNAAKGRTGIVQPPDYRLRGCMAILDTTYRSLREIDAVASAVADFARCRVVDGDVVVEPGEALRALARMADVIKSLAEMAAENVDAELAK